MATFRKRNGKWQVQIRRSDHPPLSRSFISKEDARIWSRDIESRIDRGENLIWQAYSKVNTFGDLITKYMIEVSPHKRSGKTELIVLKATLRNKIASVRNDKLTAYHFAKYRDERLTQVSPSTVRRQINVLSHIMTIAINEWGYPFSENYLSKIQKPVCNARRERRVSPNELQQILKRASRSLNPYTLPIIQIAISTGMRRGEILGIKGDHINYSNRTLIIPITKNGHERTIPISQSALVLLSKFNSSDYLFPITANAFQLCWKRIITRTNIEDLHFHDLRHEAISRFFEQGLSVPEVALISGHRDFSMLQRYTHLRAEDVAKKLTNT